MTTSPDTKPAVTPPRSPSAVPGAVTLAQLPTSVWVTAQKDARNQRRGRYSPASAAHPAKMLPAIAAHAVATYTTPGQLVLDPMCGIGTTLVEAVHLGRNALGVELEPRWAAIACGNLNHARAQGASGHARVKTGDARRTHTLIGSDQYGRVQLLLTSPPYGASLHGQVVSSRESGQPGIAKFDGTYGDNPANLAHAATDDLLEAFTTILASCCLCSPTARTSPSPPAPGATTANSSTCPPPSSPPAKQQASPPSSAASPSSPGSATDSW